MHSLICIYCILLLIKLYFWQKQKELYNMIKFLSAQLAQKDAEIEKMKKSPPPYFQSTPLADNPYQLDDHSFQSTRTTQTLPADYLTQTNRNEQVSAPPPSLRRRYESRTTNPFYYVARTNRRRRDY